MVTVKDLQARGYTRIRVAAYTQGDVNAQEYDLDTDKKLASIILSIKQAEQIHLYAKGLNKKSEYMGYFSPAQLAKLAPQLASLDGLLQALNQPKAAPALLVPQGVLNSEIPSEDATSPESVSLTMQTLGLELKEGKWVGEKVSSDANSTLCEDLTDPAAVKTALIAYFAQMLAQRGDLTAEDINEQAHDFTRWHQYNIPIHLILEEVSPEEEQQIKTMVEKTLQDLNPHCVLANNFSGLKQRARSASVGSEYDADYSPEDIKAYSGVEDMLPITVADHRESCLSQEAYTYVHGAAMLYDNPKLQVNYGNHHGYYVIRDNEILVVNSSPTKYYRAVDEHAVTGLCSARSSMQLLTELTGKSANELRQLFGNPASEQHFDAWLKTQKGDRYRYLRGEVLTDQQIAQVATDLRDDEQVITAEQVQSATDQALNLEITPHYTTTPQQDAHACGVIVTEVAAALESMLAGEATTMSALLEQAESTIQATVAPKDVAAARERHRVQFELGAISLSSAC